MAFWNLKLHFNIERRGFADKHHTITQFCISLPKYAIGILITKFTSVVKHRWQWRFLWLAHSTHVLLRGTKIGLAVMHSYFSRRQLTITVVWRVKLTNEMNEKRFWDVWKRDTKPSSVTVPERTNWHRVSCEINRSSEIMITLTLHEMQILNIKKSASG